MDGDGIGDFWDASPMLGSRNADGVFRPDSGSRHLPGRAVAAGRRSAPPDTTSHHGENLGADANDMFAYGMTVGDAEATASSTSPTRWPATV
jgi:hypothetical protein